MHFKGVNLKSFKKIKKKFFNIFNDFGILANMHVLKPFLKIQNPSPTLEAFNMHYFIFVARFHGNRYGIFVCLPL
jgi:hypothetical protein